MTAVSKTGKTVSEDCMCHENITNGAKRDR